MNSKINIFLSIITLSFSANILANNDFNDDGLFNTKTDKALIIYNKIPFLRAGDLAGFKESYGQSRKRLRREFIGEAAELIDMGAKALEALMIVKEFDKMITKRRDASHEKLSLTIESIFKAQLNTLYRKHKPKKRALDFSYLNGGLDMFMYGSYSNSSRVRGGVIITLSMVNISTNIERSFIAEGSITNAASSLAGKLFHEFHKTRFPSTFKISQGRTLELVERDQTSGSYTTPLRASYKEVQARCEDQDARLPTMRELNSLKRAGGYKGGVFITMAEQDHYWALARNDIYISYDKRTTNIYQVSGGKYLNYICVR